MNRKSKDKLVIALLSSTMSAAAALSPVLSSIANVFPEQAHLIHLLLTIPPLMIMVSSMLVNPLLGFLSSKNITVLGLGLIIFSGVYPYFSHSFLLLIISRVIMGFGLGLITTISSSLPARYFLSGKDRDTATGIQSAFASLGGVLFSLLSGMIASYYWKGVFLVQLLNLIPLIVILLFMRPNFNEEIDLELIKPSKGKKNKIFVKEAFLITFLAFVYISFSATYPLNYSLYVEQKALGTTRFTGFIASFNAFLGFVIGMSFQRINARLKTYTLPAALGLVGLSLFIVSKALSPGLFLFGSIIFGVGTSLIYPAFLTNIYKVIPDDDIIPAIGMYTVAVNISQFVSPFIINNLAKILGPNIEHRFAFASISIFIIAIATVIMKKSPVEGIE